MRRFALPLILCVLLVCRARTKWSKRNYLLLQLQWSLRPASLPIGTHSLLTSASGIADPLASCGIVPGTAPPTTPVLRQQTVNAA